MPTRLEVLLQRRKSALAEPVHRPRAMSARAGSGRGPKNRRYRQGGRSRIISRSYITLLKISRGPAASQRPRGHSWAIFVQRVSEFLPAQPLVYAAIWQNL